MRHVIAALLFALGLAAGPVAAATVTPAPTTTTLTFSGRFTSGRDNAGLFGPWGSNLAGRAFTATYQVSTFASSSTGAGVDSLSLSAPTAISFSIKINNTTQSGAANTLGSVGTLDGLGGLGAGGIDRVQAAAIRTATTGALTRTFDLSASVQSGLHNILSDTLATAIPSLSYTVATGDSASGYFQISQSGATSSVLSYGAMRIEQVNVLTTLPPAAPVPEPGEWAMLLAGLAVIGSAARRRRR